MVHGIFISFRKNDAHLLRQRLDSALTQRFGRGYVFKAGESITPGSVYPATLIQEAGACEIMLVLIGPNWLGEIVHATGKRRITDDADWVRREVAECLRAGKRAIPVLMGDGAVLPDAAELPEDLRELINHNCLRLTDARTEIDLAEIVSMLIWIQPALRDLRPVDAEAARSTEPPAYQVARTQTAGDHGTNLDNSGAIQTGGGDFTLGGVHNKTTVHKKHGAAAYAVAGAGGGALATLATIFKTMKAWSAAHRWLAPSIGALLGLGVLTVVLLPAPSAGSSGVFVLHTASAPPFAPPTAPTTVPTATNLPAMAVPSEASAAAAPSGIPLQAPM